jgi:hypothetical protein
VFRTSFTNGQPTQALGKVMVEKGHKKAVWITWKYAAGDEAGESFKESYVAAGGTIVKELGLPFPNVEFQALLTEIASIKPDAVACFFSGGGAAKFIRDYAAAGLKGKIPLYGSGFLTEGLLDDELAPSAQGIMTTLHYSASLATKRNDAFRLAYAKTYKMQPDVFAVQGYDAGLLLLQGAKAVNGDLSNKKAGEYYTPRSVVKLMVDILDPKEGETVYDPACGTGGMLIEVIEHVKRAGGNPQLLWGKLFGQEKVLTTSGIARMNLLLHGIEDFKIVKEDITESEKLFFVSYKEEEPDNRRNDKYYEILETICIHTTTHNPYVHLSGQD